MPTISVIITTYNRANILPRAIRSVLSQTFTNYELIIVDDCSTDGTDGVVSLLKDPRIRYYRLSENGGSSKARNVGFNMSKGKYVVFLDDDNEFLPTFLEDTEYRLRTADESVKGIRVGKYIIQNGFTDYAPPITTTGFDSIDWGFLMKREVMETISYDPNIYGDDDADFGIEFAKRYKQLYIDKPLAIAHGEVDEGSVCNPTPRRIAGLEYFINKHLDQFKRHPNELRYVYRLLGRNLYKAGRKKEGVRAFWESFKALPNRRTFMHYFWIHFGWSAYNRFMDREERRGAKERIKQCLT